MRDWRQVSELRSRGQTVTQWRHCVRCLQLTLSIPQTNLQTFKCLCFHQGCYEGHPSTRIVTRDTLKNGGNPVPTLEPVVVNTQSGQIRTPDPWNVSKEHVLSRTPETRADHHRKPGGVVREYRLVNLVREYGLIDGRFLDIPPS